LKYPRIPHLSCSHPLDDDSTVTDDFQWKGLRWIVTEKVDGAQISLEFENGIPIARNRNTPLLGGRMDRQFHLLPTWIKNRYDRLHEMLGDTRILFGEWMYYRHTVPYDQLPDWFIAFGMWDTLEDTFLPFHETRSISMTIGVAVVPVLFDGVVSSVSHLMGMIQQSRFGTHQMEGVVLHSPDGSVRCKHVTSAFTVSVDHGRHWRADMRVKNALCDHDETFREKL